MPFGIGNLTSATQNASASPGIGLNQTSQAVFDFAASEVAGGGALLGLIFLGLVGYVLWSSSAGFDVYVGVLVPTVSFLGWVDLIPYSQAAIYVAVLAVAGIFAVGVYRFFFR